MVKLINDQGLFMFKKPKQYKQPGPLTTAICITVICSIFLIIGASLASYGYVKYKDAAIYSKTSVSPVADIKEGNVVKIVLNSQTKTTYESPYSKIPCVFYQLQYIHYDENSDGVVSDYLDKTKREPATLTLDANNKQYLISLVNPRAEFYFKNTFTYLKNTKTFQYEPTSKMEFRSGDNIIKENIISPGEEVLVFGKVKRFVPAINGGISTIEFQKKQLPEPFSNLGLFYSHLYEAIVSNELTSYIISTRTEEALDDELHSIGNTTGLILFGLAFTIIPLIIIIGVWLMFIKSKFKLL